MKKLKYSVAIDEDGNYVAAENLTKENKGKKYYITARNLHTGNLDNVQVSVCICKDRRNHFKTLPDKEDIECKYDIKHSGESELHRYCVNKIAKIIENRGRITVPSKSFMTVLGERTVHNRLAQVNKVGTEVRLRVSDEYNTEYIKQKELVADIFCVTEDYEVSDYAIEVVVTHDIEESTLELYKYLGISVIKIVINKDEILKYGKIDDTLEEIVYNASGMYYANCEEENILRKNIDNIEENELILTNKCHEAIFNTAGLSCGDRFWVVNSHSSTLKKKDGSNPTNISTHNCVGYTMKDGGECICEGKCKHCCAFLGIDEENRVHCLGMSTKRVKYKIVKYKEI